MLSRKIYSLLLAGLLLTAGSVISAQEPKLRASRMTTPPQSYLLEKVRKELVTLPWYGVFDNLAYQIDGNTVTLSGQVTRPTTKEDAAARVKELEGVAKVVNNIEVLPVSSFDDDIRRATYQAIYWYAPLQRYGLGANPSIHIIVKNGHVTLEGVVSNKADRDLAYMRARQVPNVFSVTNNLRLERRRS